MTRPQARVIRTASVLWIIRGLVHMFAGCVMTLASTSAILLGLRVWMVRRGSPAAAK